MAGFGPAEVESLRNDPGIIRNRLKIQVTVENARTFLALQSEHGVVHRPSRRDGGPGLHLALQYPGDVLHGHESGALFHLEVQDLDDVRVVQPRGEVGFLPQGF